VAESSPEHSKFHADPIAPVAALVNLPFNVTINDVLLVVSEDAAAHIVALVKHELELQTKITPERKQYLEGATEQVARHSD
jgi:hypothetical protein